MKKVLQGLGVFAVVLFLSAIDSIVEWLGSIPVLGVVLGVGSVVALVWFFVTVFKTVISELGR